MRTKLEKELESKIKNQVEVRAIQAVIGFYEGDLSDGSHYFAVLKSFTFDQHDMTLTMEE